MDMPAAATNAASPRAGPGVAGPFLAIHLFRRAGHFRAALGAHRALPQIVLVHHHRVVQQLLADSRRRLGRIKLVGPDLDSAAVVDWQTNHISTH